MPGEPAKETRKSPRIRAIIAIAAIAIVIGAFALSANDSPTGKVLEPELSPEEIAGFNSIIEECNRNIAEKDNNKIMGCMDRYVLALKAANLTDETLARYANATIRNDNTILTMNLRGILFQKLKMFNESKAEFGRALALEPNNTVILANSANLFAEMGLKADAEENFRKALLIAPKDKSIYRNFAQFLYNNGRYAEAKDALEKSY